jgi:hypothetical protein
VCRNLKFEQDSSRIRSCLPVPGVDEIMMCIVRRNLRDRGALFVRTRTLRVGILLRVTPDGNPVPLLASESSLKLQAGLR